MAANDFIQYKSPTRDEVMRLPTWLLDLTWPPPEELELEGVTMKRLRYSQLTDEDAEAMNVIARGAEYAPEENTDGRDS